VLPSGRVFDIVYGDSVNRELRAGKILSDDATPVTP
jgi:hypothetical protein